MLKIIKPKKKLNLKKYESKGSCAWQQLSNELLEILKRLPIRGYSK